MALNSPASNVAASSESESRPPPAFQCYSSDFMAQESYVMASLPERGLLFTLLNHCWVNGSVPADITKLSKVLGLDVNDVRSAYGELVKQYLMPQAEVSDRLGAPDLSRQKAELKMRRERQIDGGRKGGKTTQERIEGHKAASRLPLSLPPTSVKASEMSRDELSREEKKSVSEKGFVTEHDEWLADYDDRKSLNGLDA